MKRLAVDFTTLDPKDILIYQDVNAKRKGVRFVPLILTLSFIEF
jgi:HKD family nuclease